MLCRLQIRSPNPTGVLIGKWGDFNTVFSLANSNVPKLMSTFPKYIDKIWEKGTEELSTLSY